MTEKRYAIVEGHEVVNIVTWDKKAVPDWKPEIGQAAIQCSDKIQIGDRYLDGEFRRREPEEEK